MKKGQKEIKPLGFCSKAGFGNAVEWQWSEVPVGTTGGKVQGAGL